MSEEGILKVCKKIIDAKRDSGDAVAMSIAKHLAKTVLEQDRKIKELQEAVREAEKVINCNDWKEEGDLAIAWLQKYGLEKEG